MDYEKDVAIDPDALDVEWLRQAGLMLQYGKYAAQAKLELDAAKEKLEVVKAELAQAIRADPGKFGLAKVTEGAVTEEILTQKSHEEASGIYLAAKYEADMALYAVRAIEQKKTALENLVRLHGQMYFAGPTVPRDLSKEWEQGQRQRAADAKVQIRRTRKE